MFNQQKRWYLNYLVQCTNKTFDIIALSETRITGKTSLIYNISLNNYSYEGTLTEPPACRTFDYISDHLSL